MPSAHSREPRDDFIVGIDVGGTKVLIRDTLSTALHRYSTNDFPDLLSLLDVYFAKMEARPTRITIAMAGPRNDTTGEIKLTNSPWPSFSPAQATQVYPGVTFATTNDMVAAAAGIVHAAGVDLETLKPGTPATTGTKFVLTISTGVGGCAAVWDEKTKRHVFAPCEPGHVGFQPYTKKQREYLEHLFKKYDYPSVEHAISGKHGMENWIDHLLAEFDAPELSRAIERAEKAERPLGAVLLEFATEGSGASKRAAHTILDHMGSLVGSILANYALAYKATGGVYLMGSVSAGLGEYWAEHTNFAQAFVRKGTEDHAPWLETLTATIPIYLSADPNIGATGALELAKQD